MLPYVLRSLPVVVRAKLRRERGLISRIERRVGPLQIDANLHLNQAVYAEEFELGRIDWVLRSGIWSSAGEAGIHPVVAEQRIIYRRELRAFTPYVIDTRMVGHEGRMLCCEGHLLVGSRVHTKVEVKLLWIGPDGVLSPEAVEAFGRPFFTEPLAVEGWQVSGE